MWVLKPCVRQDDRIFPIFQRRMSVEAVVCTTGKAVVCTTGKAVVCTTVVCDGFDGHAALAEARNIRQPKGRTTYDRLDGHAASDGGKYMRLFML
jgi:hypothetical protein